MPPKKAAKKAPAKAAPKKAAKPKSEPAKGASIKSDRARRNTATVVDATGAVPIDSDTGLPLIQIQFSASELIPTGEYANVVVGPVTVVKWIKDPQDDDELVEELNNLATLVEAGCISEQREIVLQSLQDTVE